MTKINLELIKQELELEHWQVVSDEYQNLNQEMIFQCPEGHTVYASWKKLRNNFICPVCRQNKFKNLDTSIIPKEKNNVRILSLDQATHITGWAIFDGKKLVKYGIFEATKLDEMDRYTQIKEWLISMIENWKPDYIGIEGIQYQPKIGVTTFQTLARLQGILMETCFEAGVQFQVCSTNTWRAHCEVKGKERSDKKRSMQLLIKKWFDISVTDDIADAIGIGKYLSDTVTPDVEMIF